MRKKDHESSARPRLLILVDESNVGSSVRTAGRGLDWLKLRDFLAGPATGRELIEMVVYAGLPPAIPIWQEERDKKNKFMHWLRSNGFMVVTKDGAPAEEGRYKANVDVMMAIDALELSVEMRPDVVILVTGDADFAYLAIKLRRRGIRVEVASVAQNLGNMLKSTANEVIDLAPLSTPAATTAEPAKATAEISPLQLNFCPATDLVLRSATLFARNVRSELATVPEKCLLSVYGILTQLNAASVAEVLENIRLLTGIVVESSSIFLLGSAYDVTMRSQRSSAYGRAGVEAIQHTKVTVLGA